MEFGRLLGGKGWVGPLSQLRVGLHRVADLPVKPILVLSWLLGDPCCTPHRFSTLPRGSLTSLSCPSAEPGVVPAALQGLLSTFLKPAERLTFVSTITEITKLNKRSPFLGGTKIESFGVHFSSLPFLGVVFEKLWLDTSP